MEMQILFPASWVFTAASVCGLISMGILAVMETRGIHLKYSKFFNVSSPTSFKVASRVGMFMFYAPSFFVSFASFWIFPHGDFRFLLLKSATTIHFFKRLLEVLFVHKFSGEMGLDTMIIVMVLYFTHTSAMIYTQLLTQGLPEPPIDLKYPGIVLFLIGISGNFYHHFLLSKLRAKGVKDYKIPRGGLFELVVCPHYLFEIIEFLGIGMISQTLYSFCAALGSAFYLMGRSHVTRRWYLSKFDDFPKHVKALIPYVF
ncbi:hypothetical protein PTKIN_Ptkin16aG0067000 [Pterospermum kingtungense]